MSGTEILSEMTTILRDLLGDDSIDLTMATKREDVPNWDSFNYVTFIVAVEIKFGVKFRASDVESFPDIGAIVQAVSATRPGAAH
jgi:acyl carrier protein